MKFRKLVLAFYVGIFGVSLLVPVASAAPVAQTPQQPGGQGLEISPPVVELNASPGQTITTNIRVRNITRGTLVVTGSSEDFGAKGEEGEPQIILDKSEESRFSLRSWVQGVSSFRLAPGEVKTAAIRIVVPQSAEPGGHYAVIRFTGIPPELEGSGVSLSASIGTLALLRVAGEIKEDLSVEEFFAVKNERRSWIFESGPVTFTERIRNNGSVHVKPIGYVTVTNMFNKKVAEVPISDPAKNILPDSVRRFSQNIDLGWVPGPYRAEFSATYGVENKILSSKSMTIWIIPYKTILLGILLIAVLFFGLREGIRRYNARVIAQAQSKSKSKPKSKSKK